MFMLCRILEIETELEKQKIKPKVQLTVQYFLLVFLFSFCEESTSTCEMYYDKTFQATSICNGSQRHLLV